MDELSGTGPRDLCGSAPAFLPEEAPLAMPVQSLRNLSEQAVPAPAGLSRFALRRITIIGAAALMTTFAGWEMYNVLNVGGLMLLEVILLVLFVVLFAWIAFSFANAVAGFIWLIARPRNELALLADGDLPNVTSRNALLVPTYNEDPNRLYARIETICESLHDTGQISHFDFFILSDTTDPDIWIQEEAGLMALRERLGPERLFYRHRVKNTERKAGNISDWVQRFGARFQHMIVLDADSVMSGECIVRLVAAMEAAPAAGLIQTLPIIINGRTVFARLQQFAGRLYGPMIAAGVAWWHGPESNYWGHNAIIRVAAFAKYAGLPTIQGRSPFGGHILSHDFVEAALMRRAGWAIHLVPELGGSFEETPPSITEYALRDRRWCQGNLQHLAVLPARGLHWVSRLHLLTGIGAYITAPLWLIFLLVGLLVALYARLVPPEYFPSEFSLFPSWPAQDPVRAAWVFGGTMAVLLLPKLLGFFATMLRRPGRRSLGGAPRAFVSLLLETILSGLIAPVMMLFQSRAVWQILTGHDAGWQVQRRDDGSLPFRELLRQYGSQTILGIFLGLAAYSVSLSLFLWMTPVIVGLMLATATAAFTSSAKVGLSLQRVGIFLIPEEREPPPILQRLSIGMDRELVPACLPALSRLREDPSLLSAHVANTTQPPTQRGKVDVNLVVALAKLKDAQDIGECLEWLTRAETFALLSYPPGLLAAVGTGNPHDQVRRVT